MQPKSLVEQFYDGQAEHEWNRAVRHRMEFEVTYRALREHLPPAPARILDDGGGPGRYAIHLAQRGYAVTLADLSAENVRLAQEKAGEAGVSLAGAVHADALRLNEQVTGEFDAILCLGPLYHLLSAAERERAVRQALALLRPGGVFFAAFISVFAPIRDSLVNDPLAEAQQPREGLRYQGDGAYCGDGGFTAAYFAHPQEIEPFMAACGLEKIALLGVEGLAAGHEEAVNALDAHHFAYWADLNYRMAADPALLGAADHLLYIGRKPAEG